MKDPQQVTLIITQELKNQLEQWAAKNDRSQSSELRQILQAEFARRSQAETTKQK